MTDLSSSRGQGGRIGALLLVLAALVALCLTAWRYFAPLSGITGTEGALLAMFGSFMLILAGLLLMRLPRGGWRTLFLGLSWLGVILTLVAELFLHGWLSATALAVGVIAIAIATFSPAPGRALS